MPIDSPIDMRNQPSARLVGDLRSANTKASAMPIASSEVMMWGVVSIIGDRPLRALVVCPHLEAFLHPAVELFGDFRVVVEHLLGVGLRVLDAAKVGIGL